LSGVLLDTNVALALILDSGSLTEDAKAAVAGQDRSISQVCAIEMAIKHSLGKLDLPPPFQTDFARAFADMAADLEAEIVGIELRHIDRLSRLPFFHRDPFDRLLICQSLEDELTLVTRDRVFKAYPGLSLLQI
jgi:PIN domain nuclease of toxin-antitoxin system